MRNVEPRHPARPVAYVTVQDAVARADIIGILEHQGWLVIMHPTGFHLLQAIADVIDRKQTWLDPMLIVIDEYARGCAGKTIAAGLRDLGITIPIVLVPWPGHSVPAEEIANVTARWGSSSAVPLPEPRPEPTLHCEQMG
jgi:hypothetical protein